jgi:hypothetical protein
MPTPQANLTLPANSPTVPEAAVLEAIRSLRYGSVEVTVHDSRVVQVECRNKIRFRDSEPSES